MPIDYAGIAKQYGVLEEDVVETAPEEVIDYDGIAKELGGVLEPSGVSGGTLEEQMMAAESEVPMLDAYGSPIMPPPLPPEIEQDPEFQEKLAAASEVFLTMLSGMTLGAGGQVRGTIAGLTEKILSGEFGTPEAARYIQQKAMETGAEYTYMPEKTGGSKNTYKLLRNLYQVSPHIYPRWVLLAQFLRHCLVRGKLFGRVAHLKLRK